VAEASGDLVSVTVIPQSYTHHHARRLPARHKGERQGDILAKSVEKVLRRLDVKSGLNLEKLRETCY
jgi:hypothetical protein